MDLPAGKTIFSGIQPSGTLHIGNYLGAIKQWAELQKDNEAYFCIVDLHAITVPYDAGQLPDAILDAAAIYLACGIDPDKSTIFVQSHVPAHAQLAWLLGCIASLGELKRMTQLKEKSEKRKSEASLGLFAYPILQAADILLYHTDVVPVGEDQVQHIELTRDIARRFNNRFGEVFTIPKAQVNKETMRIMSLTEPTKKMSKSDSTKSYIGLIDTPANIRKKVMSAITETDANISFKTSSPGVKNLLTILKAFRDDSEEKIEKEFKGLGFKNLKEEVADTVIEKLKPIQGHYTEIRQNEANLTKILADGKARAEQVANQTLRDVKEKMGLS
ncbi:MAG: tryptophan--tRNA ligase [bacterium]